MQCHRSSHVWLLSPPVLSFFRVITPGLTDTSGTQREGGRLSQVLTFHLSKFWSSPGSGIMMPMVVVTGIS